MEAFVLKKGQAAASGSGSRPPAKQQKSKPGQQTATTPRKRKVRTYTDKELNLPAFNGIVPAGVTQNSGKKKGKVFIDDSDEMMTILNLVRAEKDGQIESKSEICLSIKNSNDEQQ
ncbi:hypothetical protein DV738_g1055, partial [Chaetothyriales sp. CBS 135597]